MKQLLSAMEGLFLMRRMGSTYYCEDPGLATYATGGMGTLSLRSQMLRFLHSEFRAQVNYRHDPRTSLADFRTPGGAQLPFIIEAPGKGILGVSVDTEPRPSMKSLQSLTAFRKRHRLAKLLAIHAGDEGHLTSTGIPSIPWTWVP